jgi:malonate-semialdehyde dehydrogenase (acetylating) / methylmalonate-semialdehyde dehydrogenase
VWPYVQQPSLKTVAHWIGGQPVPSRSGRFGPIWDPATGDVQGRVAFASAEEVDHAVAVARQAFPSWRATALSKRADVMFRLRELVDRNRRNLSDLITREHGKTASDALGEVLHGSTSRAESRIS